MFWAAIKCGILVCVGKYIPGPEKAFQNEVMAYLKAMGIFCWNAKAIPVMKRKNSIKCGVSDILGCLPFDGRLLAIELKAPKGMVRPEQAEFIAMVSRMGGVAGVARSLKDVDQILTTGGICLRRGLDG